MKNNKSELEKDRDLDIERSKSDAEEIAEVESFYDFEIPLQDIHITCIKQKFGKLKVYTDRNNNEYLKALISFANNEAVRTCEQCGSNHKVEMTKRFFITPLCEACSTKHELQRIWHRALCSVGFYELKCKILSIPYKLENKINKEVASVLGSWTKFIYDNEASFTKRFCPYAEDVIHVSWDEENMRFTFLCSGGQHVGDSVKLAEWHKWKDQTMRFNEFKKWSEKRGK